MIRGSDEMDCQRQEDVIGRCAGQQHEFDRRKGNANKIPHREEVITSKRRKVRLKDILRNCVAQVNYLYVIYYLFLMYLFEKDEVKTSIILNNKPEAIFHHSLDTFRIPFHSR